MKEQSKSRARALRQKQNPTERRLWTLLRGRRFMDFKFRRQHPIGPYFADFFCSSASVIIELDGETHIGQEQRDLLRTQYLQANGYKVIRIWNSEFYDHPDAVLQHIYNECSARSKLPWQKRRARRPLPSDGEGRPNVARPG